MELKRNKKFNQAEAHMSIREVAEILQVSLEAIWKHIRVHILVI